MKGESWASIEISVMVVVGVAPATDIIITHTDAHHHHQGGERGLELDGTIWTQLHWVARDTCKLTSTCFLSKKYGTYGHLCNYHICYIFIIIIIYEGYI